MICLCLTGTTLDEWTDQLDRNRRWISLVELRVDLLRPAERSVDAIAAWWSRVGRGLPTILTVRRTRDGGHWEGDDAQRRYLIGRLADALSPEYLDVELDRATKPDWIQLTRRHTDRGGQVIRSHHGMIPDPREIAPLMARLAADQHEIPKLAIQPRSLADTTALLHAAGHFRRRAGGRSAVWIAMGEYGLPSRVAPALFGSAWSYASDGAAAAPGQLSPQVLSEVYRVGTATDGWRMFAVLGSPVAHSRSPDYHNGRFREDGHEALYIPVRADTMAEFLAFADAAGVRGVSVTVPHKVAALDHVVTTGGAVTETARRVGAANTLLRESGGGWRADNTDVDGAMDPLRSALGVGEGRVAYVVGAGGAARAVVTGLAADGWTVEVFNRTTQRGAALMADLGLDPAAAHGMQDLRAREPGSAALFVQTTPVGMSHGVAGDPTEGYRFSGTEFVYDLIYTPAETPLLRRAAQAGCRTLNGEHMFAAQAAAQYRQFVTLLS